jgi:hypothetical protein
LRLYSRWRVYGQAKRVKRRRLRVLFVVLLAAATAGPAAASTAVAYDAQRPALRIDSQGNAEVSWTADAVRRYLLVPARGRVLPGSRLPGRDVSRRGTGLRLPFQKVIRRTPDGRLWALQAWRARAGGPVELHFSRWRGATTTVTFTVTDTMLEGSADFQGRPVTGFSPTPEGKRLRHYAFVDCLGCGGTRMWKRLTAVQTRADGSFRLFLRPAWRGSRYRVTVAGPNRGTTLAPIASAVGGA